jgi:hypothetical protein
MKPEALKCRSCRNGCSAPPVRIVKLTENAFTRSRAFVVDDRQVSGGK